ncbi:MAG TPA: hypothetical protein VLB44_13240 [Kofleriaceae bacterium]|nr:hypothetical protein [Kofleriaceae bacterium]
MSRWFFALVACVGCAHDDAQADAVRAALADGQAPIAEASAALDANLSTTIDDTPVVFGDLPPLLVDHAPPAALDPRAQGTVTVRDLVRWANAFVMTDGSTLLADQGSGAVASQARSLMHTLLRVAATPQVPALSSALVRFELAVIAHELGEISCLASSPDAAASNIQIKCAVAADLGVIYESPIGLETTTAHLVTAHTETRAELAALDGAVVATSTAASQTQAPPSLSATLKSCLSAVQQLEQGEDPAGVAALALDMAQQQTTSLFSTALLAEGSLDHLIAITATLTPSDSTAARDQVLNLLDEIRRSEQATDDVAGMSCPDADGFACISGKLLGLWLPLPATLLDAERSTCTQALTEIAALPVSSQYDTLLQDTMQMMADMQVFDAHYLDLQGQAMRENTAYTAVSRIFESKHAVVTSSISNVR